MFFDPFIDIELAVDKFPEDVWACLILDGDCEGILAKLVFPSRVDFELEQFVDEGEIIQANRCFERVFSIFAGEFGVDARVGDEDLEHL